MVFVVAEVDPSHEHDHIISIVACFETRDAAVKMTKYKNLQYVYKQLQIYQNRSDFDARYRVQELVKSVVEGEMEEKYVIFEVPFIPEFVKDYNALRNKVLSFAR